MALEIRTAEAGGAGIAIAEAGGASPPDRKDVALVTAFVIGFVVIAFFSAVLVVTASRADRYAAAAAPPAGAAPGPGSGGR